MKIITLLLSCCLLVVHSILAQTGTIRGTVMHADSVLPVRNASVYLQSTTQGSATNSKGRFLIKDVQPGHYTLIASNVGYRTVHQEVTVDAGETVQVKLNVEEQVTDLPPVVIQSVSMTGGESGIADIPGSAQYISPREMEQFSHTDVNRTLRHTPGVNMQEEEGFGLRPNIGLRGTGVERSSKITIMEDGVLSAPAPYAAPAAYYFPTIGRIHAMEILKGSSQIKYGPFTTGGALNMISTPIPEELQGRMHIWGGSFGTRNMHSYVGNSHQNFGYLVETFQFGSNGFKMLDNGGPTGFHKQDYLAKVRVNTGPDARVYQSLQLKVGYAEETSNETYLGLTKDDFSVTPYRRYAASQHDVMNTSQSQVALRHYAQFSDHLNVVTTAYRNDFRRNWYKLDKVEDNGQPVGISSLLENPGQYPDAYAVLTGANSGDDAMTLKSNNRAYYAQGLQTVVGSHFKTNALEHTVNVGLRYHQDEIDRFQWIDGYRMVNGTMMMTSAGTPGTESNRIQRAEAFAGYLQYELKYRNLTLTPGLRYENIMLTRDDFGKQDPERTGSDLEQRQNHVDIWIPGAGVNYAFSPYLHLFAGVHKGFAPPGAREDTRPEESINYESGVRYHKGAWHAEAVGFFNDYSNLLGSDLAGGGGTGTINQFNGGASRAYGLELQLGYDLMDALADENRAFSAPLLLTYTYTDALFQNNFESEYKPWGEVQSGDRMPYLARHQLAFRAGFEHRRFDIHLSGRYQSAMRTHAGQGPIPEAARIPEFYTFDLGAHYKLSSRIAAFVNVVNLTDEVYIVSKRPAGLRPGLPRTLQAGLKADF